MVSVNSGMVVNLLDKVWKHLCRAVGFERLVPPCRSDFRIEHNSLKSVPLAGIQCLRRNKCDQINAAFRHCPEGRFIVGVVPRHQWENVSTDRSLATPNNG